MILVDGYAGTGGSRKGPGSARLMLQAALKTRSKTEVEIYLIESDSKNYAQLTETAALFRRAGINVRDFKGRIEEKLPPIIAVSSGASLFLFLDPCGALIPFDRMLSTLTGPRAAQSPPTEGFLNFSDGLVSRAAGQVLKNSADQDGAARLDSVCGGDWWREMARQHRPREAADTFEAIASEVANGYARRLTAATSMTVDIPVAQCRCSAGFEPVFRGGVSRPSVPA